MRKAWEVKFIFTTNGKGQACLNSATFKKMNMLTFIEKIMDSLHHFQTTLDGSSSKVQTFSRQWTKQLRV